MRLYRLADVVRGRSACTLRQALESIKCFVRQPDGGLLTHEAAHSIFIVGIQVYHTYAAQGIGLPSLLSFTNGNRACEWGIQQLMTRDGKVE